MNKGDVRNQSVPEQKSELAEIKQEFVEHCARVEEMRDELSLKVDFMHDEVLSGQEEILRRIGRVEQELMFMAKRSG